MWRRSSLLLISFLIIVLSLCFKHNDSSFDFLNTEVEYSSKNVTVSWNPTHGINNLYLYSVDGGEFIETSETEIVLTDLEEEWHIVEVKVVDSISLPDRYIHGVFS